MTSSTSAVRLTERHHLSILSPGLRTHHLLYIILHFSSLFNLATQQLVNVVIGASTAGVVVLALMFFLIIR